MNVLEAMKKRKSVRNFLDKSIEDEKLETVLEAARIAPSAKNRQEWRFIIVKDQEIRKKLAEAAKGQKFVGEAPVVIVAYALDDGYVMTCGQLSYPIDVAIALDHMSLAAVDVGLGTCWIGAFYEDKVKEILGIPADYRVVHLMPIGYPANESIKEKNRLQMNEIVKNEKW
ncbi:MAG: nitroreductase family protein [Candidatus Bathyarchaeota archaeon]